MIEHVTIKIGTGNAAFEDLPGVEIARILRHLADQFEECGEAPHAIRDANGNHCGEVQILREDD